MEKNKLILLYEKRSELIKRMKELPTRAKAENRDLTEAEKAEWQTIDAEYDRLSNDFLREIGAILGIYCMSICGFTKVVFDEWHLFLVFVDIVCSHSHTLPFEIIDHSLECR